MGCRWRRVSTTSDSITLISLTSGGLRPFLILLRNLYDDQSYFTSTLLFSFLCVTLHIFILHSISTNIRVFVLYTNHVLNTSLNQTLSKCKKNVTIKFGGSFDNFKNQLKNHKI